MTLRLILVLAAGCAWGQSWPQIRWNRVFTGFESPVLYSTSGDGTGRAFVVEQSGRIRLIKNGQVAVAPFLDIRARVNFSGEMGLLGLAFPPQFTTKQYFYVNYVDKQKRTTISRFKVSSGNPDVADAASEQVLLTIPQPYDNHNGGNLAFSPTDGYLYIGMGDGGSAGDPENRAQNLSIPLGKLLRIDTESNVNPYKIPPSNPYGSEVWASGLRNPWRFSFDPRNGDLYIADVGQNAVEEVDFQPGSSKGGENYGWNIMEGSTCYNNSSCAGRADLVKPVFEYDHAFGCSVTGGHIYRGTRYAEFQGIYFFGDYCSGNIWGMRLNAGKWETSLLTSTGFPITSFGLDEAGELYLVSQSGSIFQLALQPAYNISAVVSAASFQTALVPSSIGTLFVRGVSDLNGLGLAEGYPLPTTLQNIGVRIDGRPVPLFAVARYGDGVQINFLTPRETVLAAEVSVTVTVNGVETDPRPVRPAAIKPALFTFDGSHAAALLKDNSPAGEANRAARGDTVTLFATGLGEVSNPPATGLPAVANPLSNTIGRTTAMIGGRSATVTYSGLAPKFAGLYQVNAVVPLNAATGETTVVLLVNDIASPPAKLFVK